MDLTRYATLPLTYTEVGATAGPMPDGYHHVDVSRTIGTGRAVFDTAAERILRWDMHRRSGLRVDATSERAVVDAVVVLRLGPVRIPCRVVSVSDEGDARGFVYGTLPGHPESGEESFMVEFDPTTEVVTAHIRAFSKPGNRIVALGGPANRLMQRRMTNRYVAALSSADVPRANGGRYRRAW